MILLEVRHQASDPVISVYDKGLKVIFDNMEIYVLDNYLTLIPQTYKPNTHIDFRYHQNQIRLGNAGNNWAVYQAVPLASEASVTTFPGSSEAKHLVVYGSLVPLKQESPLFDALIMLN